MEASGNARYQDGGQGSLFTHRTRPYTTYHSPRRQLNPVIPSQTACMVRVQTITSPPLVPLFIVPKAYMSYVWSMPVISEKG